MKNLKKTLFKEKTEKPKLKYKREKSQKHKYYNATDGQTDQEDSI